MRRKGNTPWSRRDQELLVRFWPNVRVIKRRLSAERTDWAIYQKAWTLGLTSSNFTS